MVATQLVDRTGWDAGPWDLEPDFEVWREEGYYGVACRHRRGSWLGYGAVPPGHALWGKGANAVEAGCPTWATPAEHLLWIVYAPQLTGWWVFGFDCMGIGEYSPGVQRLDRELEKGSPALRELGKRLRAEESPRFLDDSNPANYRTLPAVKHEIAHMIEEFRAADARLLLPPPGD